MKVKPMIFNTEMVCALLDGRKVQTRRPVNPDLSWDFDEPRGPEDVAAGYPYVETEDGYVSAVKLCPFGHPGDLIYVREKMKVTNATQMVWGVLQTVVEYVADRIKSKPIAWPERLKDFPRVGKCLSNGGPREFSRLTLKVTSVRVERVQDITKEDAISEGFQLPPVDDQDFVIGARTNFRHAWQQIYGDHWDNNGWVWVIDFEVIHQNVDSYLAQQESAA